MRKYEEDARKNWDVFYKNNADRFFKDRHYLRREFPDVFPRGSAAIDGDDDDDGGGGDDDDDEPGAPSSSNVSQTPNPDEHELGPAPAYVIPDRAAAAGAAPGRVFLEVGCGAGNTTFPLLAADPTAIVYCCDFSQRAVDLVRKRAERLPPEQRARVIPFVCDATRDALTDRVPAGGVDVVRASSAATPSTCTILDRAFVHVSESRILPPIASLHVGVSPPPPPSPPAVHADIRPLRGFARTRDVRRRPKRLQRHAR